jgi:hypothetical protein
MNKQAERVMEFLDENPDFRGKVVGYKGSRGGIGISRIDNDWYECDFYLVELDDETYPLVDKKHQHEAVLEMIEELRIGNEAENFNTALAVSSYNAALNDLKQALTPLT